MAVESLKKVVIKYLPDNVLGQIRLKRYQLKEKLLYPKTVNIDLGGEPFLFKIINTREEAVVRGRYYEGVMFERMSQLLKPGDVFADIGAATGTHTLFASRKCGYTGRVLAFEPETSCRKCLRENLVLNRVDNVTVFPFGLGDKVNIANLGISTLGETPMILNADSLKKDRFDKTKTILTLPFDLLALQGVPKPTVAKIDVEGHGIKVLEGMKSIAPNLRHIFFEVHPTKGETVGEATSIFRDWGLSPVGEPVSRFDEVHLEFTRLQ